MFQHRIENRQQLAHAGGECHLLRLSRSLQALIEDTDHRIESGVDNGPHIKHSANLRASTLVRTAQYFKVQIADKPGTLAGVLAPLREAGGNLLAMHAFPRSRRTQVDVVPEDPTSFKAIAKAHKLKIQGPKMCLLVDGDDRPGALADLTDRLGSATEKQRGIFVWSPRSRAGVLLAQIVSGILQTMGGTTCANMSIFRATLCHRLESNA
jgi:hypothetical protein